MSKVAVIDLGTNTFHLIIVNINQDGSFEVLVRAPKSIKLAENGIGTIGEAPFQRGMEAMHFFKQKIEEKGVVQVRAMGTAALRTASNGKAFIQKVLDETGISIQLIDGDREAELIYKGVKQVVPYSTEPFLIMDIGGGSVEFILANSDKVQWAQSFPIGVSVLYNRFHKTEPLAAHERDALRLFLMQVLTPLSEVLTDHKVTTLVGASGTFDVLAALPGSHQFNHHAEMSTDKFPAFYQRVIQLTKEERYTDAYIPTSRADMIVVALVLIQTILEIHPFATIRISNFAMKEGIISEMMDVI